MPFPWHYFMLLVVHTEPLLPGTALVKGPPQDWKDTGLLLAMYRACRGTHRLSLSIWRLRSGFVQRNQLPITRLHLRKSFPSLQSKSQAMNLCKMTTRWDRRARLYRTLYAGWSENDVLKLP